MTHSQDETLQVEWMGINAFRFLHRGRTILLDPYVSRSRAQLCFPDTVRRHIPTADAIVVSHSHWDHLADTPCIAEYTGATVIGSETTCNICASFGIPQKQLREAAPFQAMDGDAFRVTFLPSLHMIRDGGPVPYAGACSSPPPHPPASAPEYLEGGTFAVLFEFGNTRVLNIGSANLIEEHLRDTRPDVLLLSIAGWEHTPQFAERVLGAVRPSVLIPCHFDQLEGPLERGVADRTPEATARFFQAVRDMAPETEVRPLGYFEKWTIPVAP